MSPAKARTWTTHSGAHAFLYTGPYEQISKWNAKGGQKSPLYWRGLEVPGTQYVFMVTKRFSLYCGAHKKLAEISFLIIFDQNLVDHMTSSLG